MRNRGPGQWREWRLGNLVVPMTMNDPKAVVPEGVKPLHEVAYLAVRALAAKNAMPQLTDAIQELLAAPDEPDGRVTEERFRDTMRKIANENLSPEEVENIWPAPVVVEKEVPSRKGSKRRPSKAATGDKEEK
eukprot:TRINITY_DN6649_c0_g1_i1.p2 TRINITY_DN6649_c0_g1~~TRINITY_DN6649_c0_g1_i1.p2  ORF type:complete len:133 (-),score=33.13 TRINITY_DN6649_c0_g1_i1:51-449(-)